MAGFTNDILNADNVNFTGADPTVGKVTSNGQLLIGSSVSPNIQVNTLTAGTGMTVTNGPGTITLATTASLTDLHTARFIVASSTLGTGANYTTITSAIAAAVGTGINSTIFLQPGTYTENFTLPANINLCAYDCDALTPNVTISGTITKTTAGTSSISGIRLASNGAAFLAVTGSAASIVNLTNCYLTTAFDPGITFSSSSASAQININNCQGDISAAATKYFVHSSSGSMTLNNTTIGNSGGSTSASTVSAGTFSATFSTIAFPITTSATASYATNQLRIITAFTNTLCLTIGGSGGSIIADGTLSAGSGIALTVTSSLLIYGTKIGSSNAAAISGAGTINYGGLTFFNSSSNITTTIQAQLEEGPSVTIGSENSGNTNTLTVTNTSNTASSSANILSQVQGGTAADPTHQSSVSGVTTWTWGIDNSDSDAWVLAQGTALGTNNVIRTSTAGEVTMPLQPAFLAVLATTDTGVTGNGATYTLGGGNALTEIYDQSGDFVTTGTFTAPITGKYNISTALRWATTATVTQFSVNIVTSNRVYQNVFTRAALTTGFTQINSVLADMDLNDTFTVNGIGVGSVSNSADVSGSATTIPVTWMCGYLSC
jgi:hypothetical protein